MRLFSALLASIYCSVAAGEFPVGSQIARNHGHRRGPPVKVGLWE